MNWIVKTLALKLQSKKGTADNKRQNWAIHKIIQQQIKVYALALYMSACVSTNLHKDDCMIIAYIACMIITITNSCCLLELFILNVICHNITYITTIISELIYFTLIHINVAFQYRF